MIHRHYYADTVHAATKTDISLKSARGPEIGLPKPDRNDLNTIVGLSGYVENDEDTPAENTEKKNQREE